MTKDELIAEQALEIATLKKRVIDLELQEGYQLDKWKKVTDALELSEFTSLQTVTDRIKYWSSLVSGPKCDKCGGMHYKAGESYRWCPELKGVR